MAIVTMTSEEIDAYMTPERMEEEEKRASMKSYTYDPDCPPLTEELIKTRNFHRVNPKKRNA